MAHLTSPTNFGAAPALNRVQVCQQAGMRSLHLGSAVVQSAMLIGQPFDLDLAYTRAMMAFLLFHPRAEELLMIGLGGGSLAKFVYRHLPGARTTVVEINPRVIEVAREFFFLPPNDERLQVVTGDGVSHVAAQTERFDAILVDGHDGKSPSAGLSTQEVYGACRGALRSRGVLVANLPASDP